MKTLKILNIIILILNISSKKKHKYKGKSKNFPKSILEKINFCLFFKELNKSPLIYIKNLDALFTLKYGKNYFFSRQDIIDFKIHKIDVEVKKKQKFIKHFVLIRFYCIDMMRKKLLFDNKILDNGVNVFKNYTLKTLENQSNKNFEIVLLIHNEIDMNHTSIQKLKKIKSEIKINLIRFKDINFFLKENSKNHTYLITTRIDHDDLIYFNAVQEIQSKCNENIPFYYNGYDKLITMINNDYKHSYKYFPKYYGSGSMSIFQSLIVNKKIINKIYNIYELGNHTRQKIPFINLFKQNNLQYKTYYFNVNHMKDCCVYIKHSFNHSSFMIKKLKKKWHRTKKRIKKNKIWFVQRFGKFV